MINKSLFVWRMIFLKRRNYCFNSIFILNILIVINLLLIVTLTFNGNFITFYKVPDRSIQKSKNKTSSSLILLDKHNLEIPITNKTEKHVIFKSSSLFQQESINDSQSNPKFKTDLSTNSWTTKPGQLVVSQHHEKHIPFRLNHLAKNDDLPSPYGIALLAFLRLHRISNPMQSHENKAPIDESKNKVTNNFSQANDNEEPEFDYTLWTDESLNEYKDNLLETAKKIRECSELSNGEKGMNWKV